MRVFVDKKFILVVFILFVSFVTLVYSEMVYDFNFPSHISKNNINNDSNLAALDTENRPEKSEADSADSEAKDSSKDNENEITFSELEEKLALENEKQQKKTNKTELDQDSNTEERVVDIPEESEVINVESNPLEAEEEEPKEKEVEQVKPETASGPNVVTEDIVNLQSEMELKDLIKTISEITSEVFILDDSVKTKKITIITPYGGFKKKNALRLFETLLDINGFSIVRNDDGVNKILQKKDIKSQNLPTQIGTRIRESSDRYVTRLISLKNVRVDDVSNIIKSLVSSDGDLFVYPDSNILIIIDSIDNINRIVEIINNLDVEKQIEFIKIRNAVASDVAEKLLDIFSDSPSGSSRVSRSSSSKSGSSKGTKKSVSGTGTSIGFKVITNERTNSLIVIAYPAALSKIKRIISILDGETKQAEEGIYLIRLKNADAQQIVSVLSGLLGSGGSSTSGNQQRRTNTTSSGSTVLSSSGTAIGDNSIGSLGSGSSITRNVASAGGLSNVVASTEGLRITADPSTNSIIIVGSRRDYETVKDVVDKLDIRRKQVFVEAAILEVGLDNINSLGGNFGIGATINDDTLAFGGQQLPGVPSLLGVGADSGSAVNLVGSLSGLFLGVIGEEVDPDGSGPIPPIPSFSAIFQALTSVTDVNVLSTPSIITTDNEPAEIVVADVIPFPTGSTVGTSGVTVQTIERLPVGIRLNITPQIGDGDYLNLNIVTEVSATRDAPSGLNTAEFGIATTTRSADSSVVVKNGQTLVIGGLVQDRESVLQNKTPILGDIPLIGNLFKFKQKTNRKLNLMIFLTPRIVEDETDMRKLLEEQQHRKMLLQERGLNKINKK